MSQTITIPALEWKRKGSGFVARIGTVVVGQVGRSALGYLAYYGSIASFGEEEFDRMAPTMKEAKERVEAEVRLFLNRLQGRIPE